LESVPLWASIKRGYFDFNYGLRDYDFSARLSRSTNNQQSYLKDRISLLKQDLKKDDDNQSTKGSFYDRSLARLNEFRESQKKPAQLTKEENKIPKKFFGKNLVNLRKPSNRA
jgi:hypothetical protein